MSRKKLIFFFSNLYPAYIAIHLLLGDWCTMCKLTFSVVPLLCFGGLFLIWRNTSHIKLCRDEKTGIDFLVLSLLVFTGYYCLCFLSNAKWVYRADIVFGIYIILTLAYYFYIYICDNNDRK